MKVRAALVLGAFAALAFAVNVPNASATPTATAPGCSQGPSTKGGTVTSVAGGKAVKLAEGYEFTTQVKEDAVVWKVALDAPVALSAVTALSYDVIKDDNGSANAAAAPAYRLYLDNGNALYFEPYYNLPGGQDNPTPGVWKAYDVDAGKFWVTGEGGGSYAGNRTLAQLKLDFPTAKVTHFGVGQGTYNAGTVGRFKAVEFKASAPCVKPSASASASASGSASARPSGSASSAPAVVPVGNESLPLTGVSMPVLLMLGGGLTIAGLGLVAFLSKRRKPEFRA